MRSKEAFGLAGGLLNTPTTLIAGLAAGVVSLARFGLGAEPAPGESLGVARCLEL